MSRTARQLTGDQGEGRAEEFLHKHGLRTVMRNYRCRAGEIDLVMLDASDAPPEVLVFVEVRSRQPGALVEAVETVDGNKQRRLIQAARHFLLARPEFEHHPCRFDVVGLDAPELPPRWISNAFETS